MVRRGWGTIAGLALAALLLSVVNPALLVFVPLAALLIGLPPRRLDLIAVGAVLGTLPFVTPDRDLFWYAERGWSLILAAWFLMAVVLWPRATFLPRALAAVAASLATAGGVLAAGRDWSRVDWEIARRFREYASLWVERYAPFSGSPPRQELTRLLYGAAELQALLFPATMALGSVAALGVAWWAYRRLAAREWTPLRPLPEFRFRDELVWVLIVGLVLLVLPLGGWAVRTGSNLVLFMAGLYALRGVAVLLALMGAPGLGGLLLGTLVALVLFPLAVAIAGAALVLGVTDTWLDLRSRKRRADR